MIRIAAFLTVCLLLAVVPLLMLSPVTVDAAQSTMLQGSHGNRSALPKSCRACHRGMTMALSGEEGTCLTCHGSESARQEMEEKGYLKQRGQIVLHDIESELRKPYNHPVLTVRGVHQKFEALPEEVVNATRHAECVDCHEPHLTVKGAPFRGLTGRRVGNLTAEIEQEYQLCYRCHAESANLPGRSTNKREEFKTTNPSYHPVEGEGKNTFVISLKEPYAAQKQRPNDISIIRCSDCHGSDDPDGPRGPHGSNNPGLLVHNYEMGDGRSESFQAYALCYTCHERSSILANESFPYHALHIQGRGGGSDGTSCFTCHDAHGSTRYQHLIRFNDEVVAANLDDQLKYEAQGYSARHGACFLSCHGVEHGVVDTLLPSTSPVDSGSLLTPLGSRDAGSLLLPQPESAARRVDGRY
ncbi:MAG: cytochrome c3 family protein [Desulfuromonadales bacterium]|nr:cytochrome c3 family protein [Desulfuromonadales bacterium]